MLRRLVLVLAPLSLLFAAACASAPSAQSVDTAAITQVVEEAIGLPGLTVEVEEMSGDFMRARAIPPADMLTDDAIVFLQRVGNEWRVLNYGTAFSPEDYAADNIPQELWLDN